MLFSDAITQLSLIVTKTPTDSETLEKIKLSLNYGKILVAKAFDWKQLIVPNNELIIEPNYETGTATITTGSRTVTIVGGTVSSSWVGRDFNANSRSYEIISVDTTANTFLLKTPIIESSDSVSYKIIKSKYRVPNDVRLILPNEDYTDKPSPLEIEGYDEYASDYSCTISVTENSNILTGTGTAFLDNVGRGDLIVIESNSYRVKTVLSDTRIIMTNYAISTYSGLAKIKPDTPYMAEISSDYSGIDTGSTEKQLLRYKYIRNVYFMVSDLDDTELPIQFDECILNWGKVNFGRMTNSSTWEQDVGIAQGMLDTLKNNKDLVYYSHRKLKMSIPTGFGRG